MKMLSIVYAEDYQDWQTVGQQTLSDYNQYQPQQVEVSFDPREKALLPDGRNADLLIFAQDPGANFERLDWLESKGKLAFELFEIDDALISR